MKISINESNYIKGIAITLMFAHHLFGFGDRILEPNKYIQLLPFINIEHIVASFGKICVPIFLFISGFGLSLSKSNTPLIRIFKFLGVYWYYFLIFIPIGFSFYPNITLFDSDNLRFTPTLSSILSNLFFIKTNFNGEWWFGRVYIEVIALSYVLKHIKVSENLLLLISSIIGALGFLMPHILLKTTSDGIGCNLSNLLFEFMFWQLPFIIGYTASKNSTSLEKLINMIPIYINPILCIALFHYLKVPGLILATPFFIFFILKAKEKANKLISIVEQFGKYSFPMWLIHSFFCYYYWQGFIYKPQYSILIFLNLCIICFVCAFILEKIRLSLVEALAKEKI